jgi:predicted chitinase
VKKTINGLLAGVPDHAQAAVRKNLPLIAKALEKEGILDEKVLAYALATIEHETAGTFEPIEEIKGRRSARRLGYEGGTDYFGRGFIQLTHSRNYRKVGIRIGMGESLVKNPDLALDPAVSAKILAAFFADNGIATLARQGYFVDARRPINPDAQGYWIANLAYKYLGGII